MLFQNIGATCQAFYLGRRTPEACGSLSLAPELRVHFLALLAWAGPTGPPSLLLTVVWAEGWESSNGGLGFSSVCSSLSDDFGPVAPLSVLHSPPWTRSMVTPVSAYFTE